MSNTKANSIKQSSAECGGNACRRPLVQLTHRYSHFSHVTVIEFEVKIKETKIHSMARCTPPPLKKSAQSSEPECDIPVGPGSWVRVFCSCSHDPYDRKSYLSRLTTHVAPTRVCSAQRADQRTPSSAHHGSDGTTVPPVGGLIIVDGEST